jgi:hypothetical protein
MAEVNRKSGQRIPDDVMKAAEKAGFSKPNVYAGPTVAKRKVVGRYGGSLATTEATRAVTNQASTPEKTAAEEFRQPVLDSHSDNAQHHLEAAKDCITDDEIDIVRDYFVDTGLVPTDKLALELKISQEDLRARLYED